ncbi:MAG: helix-turn-helix transcriptional regulator [Polyangiaceae bacterium]|nr:helix-turn-helix transcriptional regulator [Polyangiaceae bacterium]
MQNSQASSTPGEPGRANGQSGILEGPMQFVSRTPCSTLAPFVDYIWALQDAPAHAREGIVPSGTFELVVNLQEDRFRIYDANARGCRRFSGAMISGTYTKPFVIDTREHASIVGVHFRPGGAHPFLGVPASELTDAHVDVSALWGRPAGELRERLCAVSTTAERFDVLEAYLRMRLRRAPAGEAAVSAALEHLSGAGRSIALIARDLGMSHRRFIEVFTRQVGLTPKRFDRIQRFQRALSVTLASKQRNWTELALDCGYYDHPHLLREFGTFATSTPAELARRQSHEMKANHVAVGR